MSSSTNKADKRALTMLNLISRVVQDVTGVSKDELMSKSCAHRVTKARFIFVELCNGIISPSFLIAEYLNKNVSMVPYYKNSHNECYAIYSDFREMSDKADEMLTELLTKINGTFGDVFQEEGE